MTPPSATTTQEKKDFMRSFADATLNAHNPDAVDQFTDDNFNEHHPFPGQTQGREGLKDAIRFFITAFPDLAWTIEEQHCEGDHVTSRISFTGTHRGDFYGIPATGKKVNGWGIMIDTVTDTPNGPRFTQSKAIINVQEIIEQLKAS